MGKKLISKVEKKVVEEIVEVEVEEKVLEEGDKKYIRAGSGRGWVVWLEDGIGYYCDRIKVDDFITQYPSERFLLKGDGKERNWNVTTSTVVMEDFRPYVKGGGVKGQNEEEAMGS